MTRRCSTQMERINMFHYLNTNWGNFDLMTNVQHAQAYAIKDPARRTPVNNHSRCILVLYAAALAAEKAGNTVPAAMVDALGSSGKKLKKHNTPAAVAQAPASITVISEPAPTVLKLTREELQKLTPHLAAGTVIELV